MFFGNSEVIKSVYGIKTELVDTYEEKRRAAIEYLGEKYLLAKPMEKLNGSESKA